MLHFLIGAIIHLIIDCAVEMSFNFQPLIQSLPLILPLSCLID